MPGPAAARGANKATTETPKEWTEQEYVKALAKLERLQEQIKDLRLVPSNVVKSLIIPHSHPKHLVEAFSQAAWDGSRAVDKFKRSWEDEEIQRIFERCRESEATNPDLDLGSTIPLWGWVEEEQNLTTKSRKRKADAQNVESDDEVPKILGEFTTKENKRFKNSNWNAAKGELGVSLALEGCNSTLSFVVRRKPGPRGSASWEASCSGNKKEYKAIERCIASRNNPKDLRYLLEMLAAYKNLAVKNCDKCTKLTDADNFRPAARRPKSGPDSKKNAGKDATVWQAFHADCLHDSKSGK